LQRASRHSPVGVRLTGRYRFVSNSMKVILPLPSYAPEVFFLGR
jgi:hypothetical protein